MWWIALCNVETISKVKYRKTILTYTINAVDDGIVATVAHCQPMTTKENYVNVFISEKDKRKYNVGYVTVFISEKDKREYNVAQKELNIHIK